MRLNQQFDDFVINRVVSTGGESDQPEVAELMESDTQWNQITEIRLKPHPALPFPDAIAQEFGLRDGVLTMTCRSALKGYLMAQWSVDVGSSPATEPGKFEFWLQPLTESAGRNAPPNAITLSSPLHTTPLLSQQSKSQPKLVWMLWLVSPYIYLPLHLARPGNV